MGYQFCYLLEDCWASRWMLVVASCFWVLYMLKMVKCFVNTCLVMTIVSWSLLYVMKCLWRWVLLFLASCSTLWQTTHLICYYSFEEFTKIRRNIKFEKCPHICWYVLGKLKYFLHLQLEDELMLLYIYFKF
jgi:hypothetical protein